MDAAQIALCPLASVEATTDTRQALDATRAQSGARMAVGLQRPGAWWNAGASHMNDAYQAAFFTQFGLPPSSDCTAVLIVLDEPPYTDPYVRWCGRRKPQGFLLPDAISN